MQILPPPPSLSLLSPFPIFPHSIKLDIRLKASLKKLDVFESIVEVMAPLQSIEEEEDGGMMAVTKSIDFPLE